MLFLLSTHCFHRLIEEMVGQGRLELPTSRLSVVRSNQLSYKPVLALSQKKWWRLTDSNR